MPTKNIELLLQPSPMSPSGARLACEADLGRKTASGVGYGRQAVLETGSVERPEYWSSAVFE